jgi:DNA adenine methylase
MSLIKYSTHKIRPAVKCHGGKFYLARRYLELFPSHDVFIEPFAGGLNVLLNKPRSRIEVAGDLNGNLIEFYRCLQSQPEELIERLQLLSYSQETFDWSRQTDVNGDQIEAAARFIVRNRFSRGGHGEDFANAARTRGKTRPCGPKPGDQNSWEVMLERDLPIVAQRLQGVQFYYAEALSLIEKYDSPDVLMYLDPPYPKKTRTAPDIYAYEMTDEDHRELLETILKVKGTVAISGYHNPLYDRLLAFWQRREFEMPNHSGQGKTKQRRLETLWINRRPDAARQSAVRPTALKVHNEGRSLSDGGLT